MDDAIVVELSPEDARALLDAWYGEHPGNVASVAVERARNAERAIRAIEDALR